MNSNHKPEIAYSIYLLYWVSAYRSSYSLYSSYSCAVSVSWASQPVGYFLC